MHYKRVSYHWNRGLTTFVLAVAVLLVPAFVLTPTQAQSPAKKVLTVEDYTRWRSISGQEISGDGKWVVYGLSYTNTLPANARPVLHILNLEISQDIEVPNASGVTFSPCCRESLSESLDSGACPPDTTLYAWSGGARSRYAFRAQHYLTGIRACREARAYSVNFHSQLPKTHRNRGLFIT
jgi:hypothetical protein